MISGGLLAILFFVVAGTYAIAGLGGASSYLALLVFTGRPVHELAPVALCCNIVVTAGSVFQFGRCNLIPIRLILPFILFSVPAAFVGGMVPVREPIVKIMLAACLCMAGIYLLNYQRFSKFASRRTPTSKQLWPTALGVGGAIGLVSGMVGIGGGVFLAPILYFLRWIDARQVAAASSLFILVNSAGGLVGHAVRQSGLPSMIDVAPLLIAVLLGGMVGSQFSASRLKTGSLRIVTAILVLTASIRIVWATLL